MDTQKITKKYALNNSYFKNRRPQDPATPFEVLDYVKQHEELPYKEDLTDNWFYDCFVEYQKRAGVQNSQFFTPQKTAKLIAEIVYGCTKDNNTQVLDACCGYGQITKELVNLDLTQITAFDNDADLIDALYHFVPNVTSYCEDFTNPSEKNGIYSGVLKQRYDIVVSNPPYETAALTDFLDFLNEVLRPGGVAVLLLPNDFLDKQRPARLVQILNNFHIQNREDMEEKFARTNTRAEIVELKKIK